jgi:hypothetical protein
VCVNHNNRFSSCFGINGITDPIRGYWEGRYEQSAKFDLGVVRSSWENEFRIDPKET